MLHDVRLALRGFRQSPVFAAVAVLSLTLAIGANVAILGLLHALVWRPLPVRDPGPLVEVAAVAPNSTYEGGLTFPLYRAFVQRQQVFSSVIAWSGNSVLELDTDSRQSRGAVWFVGGTFYS